MVWIPQPTDKPSEVLRSAVDDTHAERYEDALQKFLWFYEASRSEFGLGGVRLPFALGYWLELAAKYPPAMNAISNLRDEMEQQCRDNHGDYASFRDASALNGYLDDDRRTINLFLDIAKEYPDNAKQIYHVAERLLVADGKYQQCAPFLDYATTIESAISSYKILLDLEESWSGGDSAPPKTARRNFETESATLIALLSLNDRRSEAELVRDRCFEVLDDAVFRYRLDLALSGHFPDADDGIMP
jgi:hypothetical protein